ncbi:MAG: hypothetical protein J1D89_08550 [Agathobacter sp.]|nr:hypothetical protein [Agathobacter sp.]
MKKILSNLSNKAADLLSRLKSWYTEKAGGKFGNFDQKTVLIIIVSTAVLLILALCVKNTELPTETEIERTETAAPVSETAAPEEDTIDPANFRLSEFDEALISYLCDNGYNSESFLISPASLRASLCLAAAGAQGNTRTELASAAGFSGMDAFNSWYSGLNRSAAFRVQNSVWTSEDLIGPFTASYEANVRKLYDADACSYKSDEMTQAINDWLSQKTDGAIPTAAQDLTGVSSVLLNTLNLQAAWRNSFSEAATYEGTFTGVDGKEQTMDFMEQTGDYYYVEENGTEVLVIPLDGDMSFVCFLGNRTGRFDKVTGLQKEKVHVVLPRFSLTSAFDGKELVSFLLSRGVNEAINPQTANFYNMCQGSDWFVQEIIQEMSLEISEQGVGTTAAGVTTDAAGGAEDAEAKEFVVDGPCSFAVFTGFGTNSQYMLLYGQLMR